MPIATEMLWNWLYAGLVRGAAHLIVFEDPATGCNLPAYASAAVDCDRLIEAVTAWRVVAVYDIDRAWAAWPNEPNPWSGTEQAATGDPALAPFRTFYETLRRGSNAA